MKTRMIAALLTVAMLLSMAPTAVFAAPVQTAASTAAVNTNSVVASGECGAEGGNVTWTLYEDGLLEISGSGAMGDYIYEDAPWYDYRNQMQQAAISEGVTTIGRSAFRTCTHLTSVTIPGSVTTICDYAFYWCNGLTSMSIPDSVITIGEGAFLECGSLTEIIVDEANPNYSNDAHGVLFDKEKTWLIQAPGAISGSYAIPSSVTTIGDAAFYACDGLTGVTIPDSVTTIDNDAFFNCRSLTSVTILDSVTSIGESAFSNCGSLTSVTLPDSVTAIGDSAFWGCWRLTDVHYGGTETQWGHISIGSDNEDLTGATIHFGSTGPETEPDGSVVASGACGAEGDNVTWTLYEDGLLEISGSGAMDFYGEPAEVPWYEFCSQVEQAVIETGVTTICEYAFRGCASLTSVTIPDSVTRIEAYAFSGCSSLTGITIPDSVFHINMYAFMACTGLTSVTIPDGVTTISEGAFWGCTGLTSVTIPDSVSTIDRYVFNGCSSLTSVTIPVGVTSIAPRAFDGCDSLADVHYGGTEELWAQISIGSDNEDLTEATIHYGGGSVEYPEGVIASGQCGTEGDNVTWTLYEDGLLEISGSGAMQDYTATADVPWYGFRDHVEQITIQEGIDTIGDNAFISCGNLTSIMIPDSVTRIGEGVFAACAALTSVTIPDSVTEIGGGAFFGCAALSSVTIPDGVTTIGDSVFADCVSLTGIIIPDSVTTIGAFAFTRCTGLAEITIQDSVTTIGYSAFSDCSGLTDVYYGGTEEQWAQISIGSDNEYLTEATIHYGGIGTEPEAPSGDVDGSGTLDADDAIYLLYHTLFGDTYPVTGDCDFDGSGTVDADDAIYLLYHTLFGESMYPLN